MKLTHIMSKIFLTHIVSEAAKTFGKSQDGSVMEENIQPSSIEMHVSSVAGADGAIVSPATSSKGRQCVNAETRVSAGLAVFDQPA